MIFTSPHKGRTVHLRDPQYHTDPNSGFREQTKPSLVADFLFASVSGQTTDDEGNTRISVTGGAFDTDEAARVLHWDEDDKKFAEAALLAEARNPSSDITLWEPPVPVAPIPNWEKLSPARVLAISSELGVASEALAYERATLNREDLVGMLEKKLASLRDEETLAVPA